ncbi:MAG: hypothetical protein QOC89_3809 [Paraburkholderia sp.]|nr:hypothetical protein [Paraburkholderia sp.]
MALAALDAACEASFAEGFAFVGVERPDSLHFYPTDPAYVFHCAVIAARMVYLDVACTTHAQLLSKIRSRSHDTWIANGVPRLAHQRANFLTTCQEVCASSLSKSSSHRLITPSSDRTA